MCVVDGCGWVCWAFALTCLVWSAAWMTDPRGWGVFFSSHVRSGDRGGGGEGEGGGMPLGRPMCIFSKG